MLRLLLMKHLSFQRLISLQFSTLKPLSSIAWFTSSFQDLLGLPLFLQWEGFHLSPFSPYIYPYSLSNFSVLHPFSFGKSATTTTVINFLSFYLGGIPFAYNPQFRLIWCNYLYCGLIYSYIHISGDVILPKYKILSRAIWPDFLVQLY